MCESGKIGQYFQRSDFKTLSEGQTECKKGCDIDSICKFANLQWLSDPKICDKFGSGCTTLSDTGQSGQYVYTKSK